MGLNISQVKESTPSNKAGDSLFVGLLCTAMAVGAFATAADHEGYSPVARVFAVLFGGAVFLIAIRSCFWPCVARAMARRKTAARLWLVSHAERIGALKKGP